jgi:hypothetical protein
MNLSRRQLGLGLATLSILGATSPVRAQTTTLSFLFVEADDCEPCKRWHGNEGHWWRTAPEFARVTTTFIKARRVRNAYDDTFWPPHLRRFRDQAVAGGAQRATPGFFVLRNDQLVMATAGYNAWRKQVYPALREMVAAADAAERKLARS